MRYAIISDIHSNTEALGAVLDQCNKIDIDKYICLGDIVGYNAEPHKCIEMIQALNPVAIVKGNHDEYASNSDKELEGFNPHAKQAVLWTKSRLSDAESKWLADLPLRQRIPGTNITAVHATLDSPESWGYIFDVHHAADNFSYQFTQICFCGHSHVPTAFCKKPITSRTELPIEEVPGWAFKQGENIIPDNPTVVDELEVHLQSGFKYLFNVGSIGQPRNRDPRASFAVYDTTEKTVTRYRVPYDIEATQAKILEAGLPERLAMRLTVGS
jgi:diadenosine tetraphosphatase ApaH/serine/threonine PP2A family protein phosphatase